MKKMLKKWKHLRNKMKKVPLRRCVVTKEQLPKSELLRIVRDKEGHIFPDLTGKANGRGAYIKKDINALNLAKDKKILEGAMHALIQVPELRKNLKQNTRQIISQYFDKNIVWRELKKEYDRLM